MDRVTTVIVDDEVLARRGLKTLVERRPEFVVVAMCANGREALTRIAELRPDLVLLDIQMPEISGFDVVEGLPADSVPVVVFVTALRRIRRPGVRGESPRLSAEARLPEAPGRHAHARGSARARPEAG